MVYTVVMAHNERLVAYGALRWGNSCRGPREYYYDPSEETVGGEYLRALPTTIADDLGNHFPGQNRAKRSPDQTHVPVKSAASAAAAVLLGCKPANFASAMLTYLL